MTTQARLRVLFGTSVGLIVLEIVVFAGRLAPVPAKVTAATFTIIEQSSAVQVEGYLAARFTLDIDRRIVGQSLKFRRVVFLAPDGNATLATADILAVQRFLEARSENGLNQGSPPPETVEGTLHLYPFETAKLQLTVARQGRFEIPADKTIRARIEGSTGLRKFSFETEVTPEALFRAPGS